jgi:hypothetical protein
MDARTKSSLLWGLVGALAFLVLAQGYLLLADVSVAYLPLLGIAAVVFALSAAATHTAAERLR